MQTSGGPDYVALLTRGGLVPAVMLLNMTGIKMHTLDVRFLMEIHKNPQMHGWLKMHWNVPKQIVEVQVKIFTT